MARRLQEVRDRVRDGTSLSEAFAAHRQVFDPLFLTLIEVGEATGEVADCLREGQSIMQLDIAHRLETWVQMAETVAISMVARCGGRFGVQHHGAHVPSHHSSVVKPKEAHAGARNSQTERSSQGI